MSDLLIRNIEDSLKRRIEQRARKARRSVSEEAKTLIRKGLTEDSCGRKLGTEMVSLIPQRYRVDGLVCETDEPVREPPDFS